MIPVYPTLVRNGYPMIRPCHQTHPSPSHGQPDRHPDRNHPFLRTAASNRNGSKQADLSCFFSFIFSRSRDLRELRSSSRRDRAHLIFPTSGWSGITLLSDPPTPVSSHGYPVPHSLRVKDRSGQLYSIFSIVFQFR